LLGPSSAEHLCYAPKARRSEKQNAHTRYLPEGRS